MAKQPVFTDQQKEQLAKMEIACSDVDACIAALKSLGLDMGDQEAINATRKASCQKCRAVMQATDEQG